MSRKNTVNHSRSYVKLQGTKTTEEILNIAISFEKTARDFYAALVPKVNKNMQPLVVELAEEEQHHFDLFCALKESADIKKQLNNRIKTPLDNNLFVQHIQPVDLGQNPDDRTILLYAISREDAAMRQYRDLAENVPDGRLKDVFQFLAFEEAEHKAVLEKKYLDLLNAD